MKQQLKFINTRSTGYINQLRAELQNPETLRLLTNPENIITVTTMIGSRKRKAKQVVKILHDEINQILEFFIVSKDASYIKLIFDYHNDMSTFDGEDISLKGSYYILVDIHFEKILEQTLTL